MQGTTITLSTKTALRYEGVVASTSSEGDTTGVTLKDVKEISNPGAPLKDTLFIASTNIDQWSSGPADAKAPVGNGSGPVPTAGNGDSFKTDVDISTKGFPKREKELKAWADDTDELDLSSQSPFSNPPSSHSNVTPGRPGPGGASGGAHVDDLTFGAGAATAGSQNWDQFAANERLFGVRTQFDEDQYTTKIDRSAADYRERERRAQMLANEIQSVSRSSFSLLLFVLEREPVLVVRWWWVC